MAIAYGRDQPGRHNGSRAQAAFSQERFFGFDFESDTGGGATRERIALVDPSGGTENAAVALSPAF